MSEQKKVCALPQKIENSCNISHPEEKDLQDIGNTGSFFYSPCSINIHLEI